MKILLTLYKEDIHTEEDKTTLHYITNYITLH